MYWHYNFPDSVFPPFPSTTELIGHSTYLSTPVCGCHFSPSFSFVALGGANEQHGSITKMSDASLAAAFEP